MAELCAVVDILGVKALMCRESKAGRTRQLSQWLEECRTRVWDVACASLLEIDGVVRDRLVAATRTEHDLDEIVLRGENNDEALFQMLYLCGEMFKNFLAGQSINEQLRGFAGVPSRIGIGTGREAAKNLVDGIQWLGVSLDTSLAGRRGVERYRLVSSDAAIVPWKVPHRDGGTRNILALDWPRVFARNWVNARPPGDTAELLEYIGQGFKPSDEVARRKYENTLAFIHRCPNSR